MSTRRYVDAEINDKWTITRISVFIDDNENAMIKVQNEVRVFIRGIKKKKYIKYAEIVRLRVSD